VRIALVVPRSVDDDAVRSAAIETYRDLVAEGHVVDCFLVADPRAVDGFGDDARTRLCVVDHEFRAERWTSRSSSPARIAEALFVRAAAVRLRRLLARTGRRVSYDAFVEPRWRE
jgi:hypothetical protein